MKFHLRDLCWLLLVAALGAFCVKLSLENRSLKLELLNHINRELRDGEESFHGVVDRYIEIPPEPAESGEPSPGIKKVESGE